MIAVLRRIFWSSEERRLRAGWRILLLLLATLLASLAAARLARLLHGPAETARLFYLLLAFGALLVVVVGVDRRPLRDLGIRFASRDWIELALGCLAALAAILLVFALSRGLGWESAAAAPGRSRGLAFWSMLATQAAFGLFSCTYEEALCRGYLLRNLAEGFQSRRRPSRRSTALALGLSSLLFGLMHLGNPHATLLSLLVLTLFGALAGWVFLARRSLAMPIGLHFGWNFALGDLLGLPVSGSMEPAAAFLARQHGPPLWTGGAFGPEAGLSGLVAVLLLFALQAALLPILPKAATVPTQASSP